MSRFDNAVFDRRNMLLGAAGMLAAGFAGTLGRPGTAEARGGRPSRAVPEPKPVPGGTDLGAFGLPAPFDFIHVFTPGPTGVVLPFSGIPLEGLHVEPSVITDFRGDTALAYVY